MNSQANAWLSLYRYIQNLSACTSINESHAAFDISDKNKHKMGFSTEYIKLVLQTLLTQGF